MTKNTKHLHVILSDKDYKIVAGLAHKFGFSKRKAVTLIARHFKMNRPTGDQMQELIDTLFN